MAEERKLISEKKIPLLERLTDITALLTGVLCVLFLSGFMRSRRLMYLILLCGILMHLFASVVFYLQRRAGRLAAGLTVLLLLAAVFVLFLL